MNNPNQYSFPGKTIRDSIRVSEYWDSIEDLEHQELVTPDLPPLRGRQGIIPNDNPLSKK
jgi:hypothetical protein